MGVFKLGFLVELVSEPIIAGFTSGAAFLIAATQFSNMLGIHIIGIPAVNTSSNPCCSPVIT